MSGDDNVVQGDFHALGHAGSGSFDGLEIFELNEVMDKVVFNSDEFTAVCPVTGQPDLYELDIVLNETCFSIESKSLKLYLNTFRNEGCFAENLTTRIKREIFNAIDSLNSGFIFHEDQVRVTIIQKRRGGIEVQATA